MSARVAALDLGSNSFHLALFELRDERGFEQIERAKHKVQLGHSVFRTGVIDVPTFDRGIAALRTLRAVVARSRPETVLAVATSALREAENGAEFLAEATRVVGFPIRLISGYEEARLVALGTSHALRVTSERLAIFDLGGGSLEVIVSDGPTPAFAASLPIGTLRSRADWSAARPPSWEELSALRQTVRAQLEPTLAQVRALGFQRVVLSCGAARDLLRMADEQRKLDPLAQARRVLPRPVLGRLHAELANAVLSTAEHYDPRRDQERLLIAATVFELIAQGAPSEQLEIARGGLRHGLVADYVRGARARAPLFSAV